MNADGPSMQYWIVRGGDGWCECWLLFQNGQWRVLLVNIKER